MHPRIIEIPLPFDIFGVDTLSIYSFGLMVALAFMAAAWLSRKELDRLYADGRLPAVKVPVVDKKGKRARKQFQMASPGLLMGTITVIAVGGGFLGAKLFHILENLDDFARDPAGMVFSTGGFTFYGGLVVAALAISWYVRKKGLQVAVVADALAPGLMIAYGIGRIGCHLSGDGDWGIAANLAARPSWVPIWFWAETYPDNILNETLAQPVYPTPLYEFLACALLFAVLWRLRRHPFLSGWLFSLYLILTGLERFLIELIRVNNRFDLFGLTVTQAEVISVVLVTAGVIGLMRTWKRREDALPDGAATRTASAVS